MCNALTELDQDSSPGYIGIETVIFKESANELSSALTDLFNHCIKDSKIPEDWKISYVTREYKGKGSNSEFEKPSSYPQLRVPRGSILGPLLLIIFI